MFRNNLGKFIVFEGTDGTGTTSQSKLLTEKLPNAFWTKEPSSNPIGKVTRQLLKDPTYPVDKTAMCLLYVADRLQHTTEKILPALKKGKTIVCDRYIWSTFAYQSIYFGEEWINELHKYDYIHLPDLTILLDCEMNVAEMRRNKRKEGKELYDDIEVQEKARKNYLKLAGQYPDRCATIDANKDFDTVQNDIYKIVMRKCFKNELQSDPFGN